MLLGGQRMTKSSNAFWVQRRKKEEKGVEEGKAPGKRAGGLSRAC
jgi:hypothetical protein